MYILSVGIKHIIQYASYNWDRMCSDINLLSVCIPGRPGYVGLGVVPVGLVLGTVNLLQWNLRQQKLQIRTMSLI